MHTSLPWANCRLQLASEVDEDADLPQGVVGRLYHTPSSHPAVRQNLQALETRKLSLPALAVQHVVNQRGPDALIGCIPGETKHKAKLEELCRAAHAAEEVLVCHLLVADVVLVPREPSVAARDGLFFVVYATNLRAVLLCEELRARAQVAVVLDVDNTLIDASAVTLPARDWASVSWQECVVETEGGRAIRAQWARLNHVDPVAEEVFLMHYRLGSAEATFHVRVRRGWAALRAFLAQNADRFVTFICSKGKQEYLQLLWSFLDPEGELMPRSRWPTHMTSTFPDALPAAAPKTALSALGCASVLRPHVATQFAAPVIAFDDSRAAYYEDYEKSIMYVEEYAPSEGVAADGGSVLRQAVGCLEAFWQATCTEDGAFAWQAAQSFSSALLATVRRTPMESPDAIAYLQARCRKQGEVLWHQFTAEAVFGGDNIIRDRPLEEEIEGLSDDVDGASDDVVLGGVEGVAISDNDKGGVHDDDEEGIDDIGAIDHRTTADDQPAATPRAPSARRVSSTTPRPYVVRHTPCYDGASVLSGEGRDAGEAARRDPAHLAALGARAAARDTVAPHPPELLDPAAAAVDAGGVVMPPGLLRRVSTVRQSPGVPGNGIGGGPVTTTAAGPKATIPGTDDTSPCAVSASPGEPGVSDDDGAATIDEEVSVAVGVGAGHAPRAAEPAAA